MDHLIGGWLVLGGGVDGVLGLVGAVECPGVDAEPLSFPDLCRALAGDYELPAGGDFSEGKRFQFCSLDWCCV